MYIGYGKASNSEVCSGKGVCVKHNECLCSDGYAGYNCNKSCDYCNVNYDKRS
jgi:hypothetical protein